MNKEVKVCANDAGAVIVPSENNPEYGYIRVEQKRIGVDSNGFAKVRNMSALIPGKIEDLRQFGWTKDQMVSGKVYFKEQLTPFNLDDPEKHYKYAGDTGVVCKIDGQPMYRKTFFSPDASQADIFIRDEETGEILSHDNTEEIKAAYESLAERSEAKADESLSEG